MQGRKGRLSVWRYRILRLIHGAMSVEKRRSRSTGDCHPLPRVTVSHRLTRAS